MDADWNDWLALRAPILLVAGALTVLGIEAFGRREIRRAASEVAGYLSVAAALAAVIAWIFGGSSGGPAFGGAAVLDPLAAFLTLAIVAATGLTLVLTGDSVTAKGMPQGEYSALVLLSAAGMTLLVQATELVTFFVAIEILSIGVYVLSGYFRRDPRSNEASIKYLVMGAFASGFLLYGLALLYGATGEVGFAEIGRKLDQSPALAALGFTLLGIGLAFKVGAVPFHMWIPDVYEGAPVTVTAFMSVTVKAAGFGGFLRLLLTAGAGQAGTWAHTLMALSLATMIAGNLAALWQQSVKRMLAYSSVAHTGYLLAAFSVLGHDGAAADAATGAAFYLFAYTFMTLGAFAFVMAAGRNGQDAERIEDYAGLARKRPWMAAAMTLFMVSLAGIPPTAGFLGKFLIFRAAIEADAVVLVVVGVLTSAVSAYYYLRVAVYMYMHPETGDEGTPAPSNVLMVVGVTAVFTVLLGVFPARILDLASRAIP